jgi:hypothetical protein
VLTAAACSTRLHDVVLLRRRQRRAAITVAWENRQQPLLLEFLLNVFPLAPCKAVNVYAIALAIIIAHLERWRAILMAWATAKAVALPLPGATEGKRDGSSIHLLALEGN